jgi:MFS family permease
MAGAPRRWRALPGAVWTLGFVSLFMDASSELVHSLLPLYMSTVLGASMASIGLIEGLAEGATAFTRVFSGALSDRLRRRKDLVVLGYGLAALSKPAFPLATSLHWVFGARLADRIGKGIREAPRDALISDVTPPGLRGAAYGLRQSLDSVGAFVGPALAIALMGYFAGDLKAVLWAAVIPALIAVALLALGLREPPRGAAEGAAPQRLRLAAVRRLGARYWMILLLGATFALARFSEAFLLLRAQSVGLSANHVPSVMIAMNLVYAAAAYPAGAAADWTSRRALLLAGFATLVTADALLASAEAPWHVLVGAGLWGLQMALTQGLMSKLVAGSAPEELRGTAFGIYSLVNGVCLIVASAAAGQLWDRLGPAATFMAGGSFAALCLLGLRLVAARSPRAA